MGRWEGRGQSSRTRGPSCAPISHLVPIQDILHTRVQLQHTGAVTGEVTPHTHAPPHAITATAAPPCPPSSNHPLSPPLLAGNPHAPHPVSSRCATVAGVAVAGNSVAPVPCGCAAGAKGASRPHR